MITARDSATTTLDEFKHAQLELESACFQLTLFVAGASALSARAVADIRAICETYLPQRYVLQIVDVRKNPDLVRNHGVLATPTLIKEHPLPRRVLVGSLTDTARVLSALDITADPPIAKLRRPSD